MYAGKVELCGVDTARLPVLSEAEKSRLIKAARAGDRQARQEMVQGNLRLVLSVVQRFAGRGENMDDLFQVGCIGLIKAIDNFDPAQQVRFSTYGVPMIVGEVKRYLRDNNAVRVSRSIRDLAYHSMQAREELQKQNGREPKLSEIAARVGQSPENVAMALESAVTRGAAPARKAWRWRWGRCASRPACTNPFSARTGTAFRWWTACATTPTRKAGSAT